MESQELDKNPVVHSLRQWDRGAVAEVIEFKDETTVVVPRQHFLAACQFLASEPALRFNFLSDIVTTDQFPLEPRFEVNYHLLALERRDRIRLKVKLGGNDPSLASVTSVWPGANWHERENYDLFGIQFEGHPDLKRILMPDDWEGHPLRKDYPVEGHVR